MPWIGIALALFGIGCLWWAFRPRSTATRTLPAPTTNITVERMLVVVAAPQPTQQPAAVVRGHVLDVKI